MLVKRRISIFLEKLEAYKIEWSVFLVPTTKNKADTLTRVPKHWLTKPSSLISAVVLHERFPINGDLAENFMLCIVVVLTRHCILQRN